LAQQYTRLAATLETNTLRIIADELVAANELALRTLASGLGSAFAGLPTDRATTLAQNLAAAADEAALRAAIEAAVPGSANPATLAAARTWISRFASRGSNGPGSFEILEGQLAPGFQRNHLNQNAVFRNVISEAEGLVIPLQGDAIFGTGTPHWRFHQSLEAFWEQWRTGPMRGQPFPTYAEYGRAVQRALEVAGLTPTQAADVAAQAARQRAIYGLAETGQVPRIPARLNQQ
jgi:hypothetical protein